MAQDDSCGTGMAAQARFPTLIADTTAAMARVVSVHTTALDGDDSAAAEESRTWNEIAELGNDVAQQARDMAQRMRRCRDLPGAEHDMTALTSPEAIAAFQDYAAAQRALRDYLDEAVATNDAMLRSMHGAQ